MKISKAFEDYIEQQLKMRGAGRNTIIHVRLTGRSLIEVLGDKHLARLTCEDVAKWRNEIEAGRSMNTVRNRIVELRGCLRYWRFRGEKCIDYELIPVPKRRPFIPEFCTAEEVRQMIECSHLRRTRAIVSLLFSSGIRLSEMLQLDRDSIVGGSFSVKGKGGKIRVCFVDNRTQALIDEYLETRLDDNPALFVSKHTQTRMTATNVQMAVKNAARAAGIARHITPHSLRHSFASDYLHNGGNMRYLQVLLGHADLSTTAHYSHFVDQDLYRAYRAHHSC